MYFFSIKAIAVHQGNGNLLHFVCHRSPCLNPQSVWCIERKHFSMPLIIFPGKRAKQSKRCEMCQRSTHMCFQFVYESNLPGGTVSRAEPCNYVLQYTDNNVSLVCQMYACRDSFKRTLLINDQHQPYELHYMSHVNV